MARINDIEQSIADTIIERPHGFKVGSRQFYLYPVTLGKTYLIGRIIEELEINNEILSFNPYLEALRICETKKDSVSRLIAYHTVKTKDEAFDYEKINERAIFLDVNLTAEEKAQILILLLTDEGIEKYVKHFKIDREKEDMQKVLRCKNESKGTYTFGGKSIYGSMIDFLAQRYGWTMDYILWGISYKNLQMLLADMTTSIHLSDDEAKKCRVSNERNFISGDDINNMDKIKKMFGG